MTTAAAEQVKPSRFNILFEESKIPHLFNTRSGAFLRLPNYSVADLAFLNAGSSVDSAPDTPPTIDFNQLPSSLGQELLTGGFVIDGSIDELAALQIANRVTRYSTDSLVMTLVVTHNCNFDCVYCYEDRELPSMGVDVQDKLIQFVTEQKDKLSEIGITWFGGEPLAARDVIQRLSVKLIDLCIESGIDYHADIITNGYLLTRTVAQELRDLGVTSAQITLDGTAEIHDQRRPLVSGRPTFDRILDNIMEVHDLIPIVIRMNLDSSNLSEANKLIDFLADNGLEEKVQLSFAPVHDEGKGCRERSETDREQTCEGCAGIGGARLLRLAEFGKEYVQLYQHGVNRGFPFNYLPQSKANACTADLANSYVVEPDGKLHKCWQTVTDPEQSIGTVFTGTKINQNHAKWLTFDPFSLEKCKRCRVLPICMGWCPIKIMNDPSPESCNVIKHTLTEELILYNANLNNSPVQE